MGLVINYTIFSDCDVLAQRDSRFGTIALADITGLSWERVDAMLRTPEEQGLIAVRDADG